MAGDLCRAPANGVHWLATHIAHAMPCVYVAGNHEFYKGSIKEDIEDGKSAAARIRPPNKLVLVIGPNDIGPGQETIFTG